MPAPRSHVTSGHRLGTDGSNLYPAQRPTQRTTDTPWVGGTLIFRGAPGDAGPCRQEDIPPFTEMGGPDAA